MREQFARAFPSSDALAALDFVFSDTRIVDGVSIRAIGRDALPGFVGFQRVYGLRVGRAADQQESKYKFAHV